MLIFAIAALTALDTPGIYMDAVNPDYLVVPILHPAVQLPDWTLPGTFLFGRFPLLGQLYHGALSLYIALPAYALFGTGILGIRIANLLFGLLVLAATAAFLRAFRVPPLLATLTLAALALDPAFLFAFRTQLNITLLPAAPLLASIALIEHRPPTKITLAAAGLLAGLAVWGYFIAAFALPVLALHAWRRHPRRQSPPWLAGLALGLSPYPLAMLLLLAHAGPSNFPHIIAVTLSTLAPTHSTLSPLARLDYFAQMLRWTIQAIGPAAMMLHTSPPLTLPAIKDILLLAFPAIGLLIALRHPTRNHGLLIAAALVAAFALLFLTFGDRLWLSHLMPLLPILYIALALTLAAANATRYAPLLLAPLLLTNTIDTRSIFAALRQTGGIGLASDALTRFARSAARDSTPTHAYFPDWGIYTSFVMLTAGRIPATLSFDPTQALRTLCAGQDVLLATIASPAIAPIDPARLPTWIAAIPWPAPTTQIWRQRDGDALIMSTRWHAQPTATGGACQSP